MGRKKKSDLMFRGIFAGLIGLGAFLAFLCTPEQREQIIGALWSFTYAFIALGIVSIICATLRAFYVAKLKKQNKPLPSFLENVHLNIHFSFFCSV